MPTDKARVMMTVDPQTYEMLQEIGEATSLSVAGIIGRFLGSHAAEVAEYYEWLKKEKSPAMRMIGNNLLQSYGPENLIEGIRRIDPTHEFLSDGFAKGLKRDEQK